MEKTFKIEKEQINKLAFRDIRNKTTIGLVRSAFVFNKAGKLTHAQRNLRAKDYAERLLTMLAP